MTASIIRTEHAGDVVAMTAIHDRAFAHRLGGVRFVDRGGVDEVRHLAAGMSEKCAASRMPMAGQKTLVICPNGVPRDPARRAAILADHIRDVVSREEGGIFGPDMECGSDVLDLLASRADLGAYVTGLSVAHDGLDINGHAFTARGLLEAFDCFTRLQSVPVASASIQGFGMVAAPVARGLAERGVVVRAVSNRHGVLLNGAGLDVPRLFELWRTLGDDCLTSYVADAQGDATFDADPGALFTVEADVLVPAARTTVLARSDELDAARLENRDVRSVEELFERAGWTLVLEAANHPLTEAAEEYLERHGVAIVPDVLVNIGGMIGCYAEWRYRHLIRSGEFSSDELAKRCHEYTKRSVDENVRALVTTDGSARCAAATIVRRNRAEMILAPRSHDDPLELRPIVTPNA